MPEKSDLDKIAERLTIDKSGFVAPLKYPPFWIHLTWRDDWSEHPVKYDVSEHEYHGKIRQDKFIAKDGYIWKVSFYDFISMRNMFFAAHKDLNPMDYPGFSWEELEWKMEDGYADTKKYTITKKFTNYDDADYLTHEELMGEEVKEENQS